MKTPISSKLNLRYFGEALRSRKGDVWLVSAKWAAPVLSLVGGILAARSLSPEALGAFQVVALIPVYTTFLQLGVFNGLNRNLPLCLARDQGQQAQDFVNASARVAKYCAVIGAVGALGATIFFLFNQAEPLYAYIALFLVPGLVFRPLRIHQDTIYRGTREFERLGKSQYLQNFWVFLCSASTSLLGITALGVKLATQNLVGWLFLLRGVPFRNQGNAKWSDARRLSAVGLPMLVTGLIFSWLSAADRTIVAALLSAEDLGFFALSGLALNSLRVFPQSINVLLYPRVAHAYGVHGSSRHLRRYIWIGLGLNLAVLIPTAIIGWFLLPHLVHLVLPAYVPGIPAAKVTLLGAVFFAYSGPSVVVPIVRRNTPAHIGGVIAIGLVWIGGMIAISAGYGIVGVACARLLANAFYGVFMIAYVFHLTAIDIPCKL